MTLKLNVDSLESVDEPFRALYVEKDGKFSLAVDGLDTVVKDAHDAREATKRASKEAIEERKKRQAWEKLGKTPEEIAEMLTAFEETERLKAEATGDHAKILKQHQDKWTKEKSDLEAELNAARASERGAIIGNSVMTALTKEGSTEEGVDLLPERLANRIKFETRDGSRVLKIMQADGVTPMAGSGPEGSATIDDLVKEAKGKWPSLFKGNGQSGSGTPPAGNSGATSQKIARKSDLYRGIDPKNKKAMDKARAEWVTANGAQAYFSLPD